MQVTALDHLNIIYIDLYVDVSLGERVGVDLVACVNVGVNKDIDVGLGASTGIGNTILYNNK